MPANGKLTLNIYDFDIPYHTFFDFENFFFDNFDNFGKFDLDFKCDV